MNRKEETILINPSTPAAILLEKCLGCQSYVFFLKSKVVDLFCPIKY